MKILIVDDSIVYRTQISHALTGVEGIEIVGSASNGKIALQKLEQAQVDLVTLDVEMPEMDGMATLKEIRRRKIPVKVIFFSSQTQKGAELTLQALREGADDFVAKPAGETLSFETAGATIKAALIPKILQFFTDKPTSQYSIPTNVNAPVTPNISKLNLSSLLPQVLVIGSSTGGPAALEKIFAEITPPFPVPILIVQHMPPVFTQILAKRLGEISGIESSEGKDGETIRENKIYVAPGDFHMLLSKSSNVLSKDVILRLSKGPMRNSVRPAVDELFESAAAIFKKGCLGIVLTGMGEDGLQGAKVIKQNDGGIMIQDKASSVVFGMPGAIYSQNCYDEMLPLSEIAQRINFIFHKSSKKVATA